MPQRYKLIIFDWDGTLMDSAAAISASLQAACADLELPVPSDQAARHIIGLGMQDALRCLLPDIDPSHYPRVAERYRHHFLIQDAHTALFPGAADAIRKLHGGGHLLAVATGKSRRGLDRALAATGLAAYFHRTRCADEGHTKPDPAMLHCLLNDLHVRVEDALMIGDTTHDITMAHAAGVAALAVAYGAHAKQVLLDSTPLACLDTEAQLWEWLAIHA